MYTCSVGSNLSLHYSYSPICLCLIYEIGEIYLFIYTLFQVGNRIQQQVLKYKKKIQVEYANNNKT